MNTNLFDASWRESVKNAEDSWVSDVLECISGSGAIYLNTISRWFYEFPGSNKQKKHLKVSLRSVTNSDHLGAVNELSWWKLWVSRGYDFTPIQTGELPTPDFILKSESLDVIFEITTLNPSKDERCRELKTSQKNSIRRIVAKVIEEKADQLRYGCKNNIPSIFVLFNYDEWSGFGTQFYKLIAGQDFIDAMPKELSAIVYVEKLIVDGIPYFKKSGIVVVRNPGAYIKYSEQIMSMIVENENNENMLICENA